MVFGDCVTEVITILGVIIGFIIAAKSLPDGVHHDGKPAQGPRGDHEGPPGQDPRRPGASAGGQPQWLNLGRLHTSRGDLRESDQVLRRAADICHRHGHRREEAECWQLLGEAHAHHGNRPDAHRLLRRSLHLWREFGTAHQIAAAETALRELA